MACVLVDSRSSSQLVVTVTISISISITNFITIINILHRVLALGTMLSNLYHPSDEAPRAGTEKLVGLPKLTQEFRRRQFDSRIITDKLSGMAS